MSLAGNLIYTIGLDTSTGMYSLITVDPSDRIQLGSTNYGSGDRENPLQMVSMISLAGILYQGTEKGLIRVQAGID